MCIKSDWTEAALPGVSLIILLNWSNPFHPMCIRRGLVFTLISLLTTTDSVLQRERSLSNCHKKTERITLFVVQDGYKNSVPIQADRI